MTSKIEVKLSKVPEKTTALLRFQTPSEELFRTENATIQEVQQFAEEGDDVAEPNIFHMTDLEVKEHKKKAEIRKQLESETTTVLTLENQGKTKKYVCRPEKETLSKAGYFVMRRSNNCMILTPIDYWYNVQLGFAKSKLSLDEAEKEFTKMEKGPVGSKLKRMSAKIFGQNSEGPPEKKSNGPVAKKDESEDKKETAEERAETREKNRLFGGHLYTQLSDSESEQSDLNEQGKELSKILKKTSGEFGESDVSDDIESDQESDIDALEKKYSQTEILKDLPFDLPIPGDSDLHSSVQRSGTKETSLSVANKVALSESSHSPISDVLNEREPVKKASIRAQVSQKNEALEKLVEEKMLKYLERQSMNTALLLKKLLTHAPPDATRDQIVVSMANIIKRLGIHKRIISGQTYLDLKK